MWRRELNPLVGGGGDDDYAVRVHLGFFADTVYLLVASNLWNSKIRRETIHSWAICHGFHPTPREIILRFAFYLTPADVFAW